MRSGHALLVSAVSLLSLTACTGVSREGEVYHRAQQALIGKTKQELLACAGPPVSEMIKTDRTVMVYYREASQLEESFPGSKGSFAMVHHGCRATIILRADRVDNVRYESVPSSYRDEDHCEEVFVGCVGNETEHGKP